MSMRAEMRQDGFSLVELLVAMMMTLIVSGAIFGLLTAGQNAFRREPELADLQQNIRMGMDMITRDIVAAGSGMRTDAQVFTRLDYPGGTFLNNPPAGSVPSVLVAGEQADFLEIMVNDPTCPTLTTTCGAPGANIPTSEPLPFCLNNAAGTLAYVYGPTGSAPNKGGPQGVLFLTPGGAAGTCGGSLNAPGTSWRNQGAGFPCAASGTKCDYVSRVTVARYQVAPDPDDPTGQTPALWRSTTGTSNAADGVNNNLPPTPPWQVVARGIEDLQVKYSTTGGGWVDSPPVVSTIDPTTWVREVQVTLSARSTAQNLTGQTTSVVGNAVRTQLVSVVSPRAALLNLDVLPGNLWK
jgi:type II secretory pathway pseudopilin PulG